MSAVDLWYEKLQKSITLPFGSTKRVEGSLLLYAIELVGLEFKQLSDGEYSLRLCFFDFQTRRFCGGQWRQKCAARQSSIHLDQHLLFRSAPLMNASIVIVTEFGDSHGNALCWAAIPLGGTSQQIEPSNGGGGTDATIRAQLRKSFPLYAGSSRVLFLASSGLNQLEPHLRPLDAIISASLRILSPGGPSPRWGLPAFHFLAQKEIEEEASSKFTALLDNLRLEYSDGGQIAGDSFLLDLVSREYCYALNRPRREGQPPSGIRVLERRLKLLSQKIGAHDGLNFLEEPICVLLEVMPSNGFANQSPNSMGLQQRSQSLGSRGAGQHSAGVDFGVRQSVRLRSLPIRPDLAIIFQLEYLVGCPLGNGQELLANAHLIRVAWTAWCPCPKEDNQISQADTICVHLLGGPRPSPMPFGRCLRDLSILPSSLGRGSGQWPPLPPQRVRLDLHFNFVPLPEDVDGIPKAISRLSVEQQKTPLPRPDRLPVEEIAQHPSPRRPPSAPATSSRRSIPPPNPPEEEEQLLLTVQIPRQQNKTQLEEADSSLIWPTVMAPPSQQQQLPTIEQFQPAAEMGSIRVELPLGRVHPLPRQMIPLMAKFPAISGQPGPPPKMIDIQTKMELNLELEGVERRWSGSEFSLQFLAFLPAQSAFPRARQPPRLFFSFQFYRFEPLQTEALFGETSTLPDGTSADSSPMLLWREGGRQAGLTTRFVIDPGRQSDFAAYLFGHQLHLHIWEADTLFHLGCATLPLRFLLRQGTPGVQCTMQAPIFQSGFPPAWQPSQGGTTLNGLLFLRMANVGLPENTQKTHPNRKGLVPALRSQQQGPLERFLALQKLDLAQRSARLFGPAEEKRLREWAELKGDGDKAQQLLTHPNNSAQKFLFAEELAAYKAIRREGKAMALLRAVYASIITKMQITLTLGQLRLFPFKMRNPMAEEFICELETTDDRRIRPILDVDEWNAYFRQQGGGNGGERILWEGNGPSWRMGIRPMEQLDVPMRFEAEIDEEIIGEEDEQEVRVFVRRLPSGHPLAILDLHTKIRRSFISQHFHWHTEECCKLIRSVDLQKRTASVRCSDPTVNCQLEDAGRSLRIECQIGESPQLRQFLLFLYATKLPIQLQSVWRISIHSFGRLYSETVQGQPIRIPLPLPTSKLATILPEGELIALNCSPPIPSLRFHPGPVFPATNFGTTIQPAVLFSLVQLGRFHLLINAIRTASQQPIGQWILSVSIGQPNITKVFQVIVPAQLQQIVHKRIPLDNPLAISRQFQLSSSDCSLITVPQPLPPPIGPNSSIPIQLDIHPPPNRPGQYQALFFVQDAQTGSQEEAFQLNIRFH